MYVATSANTHVGRFMYVATTANTHGVYKSFDCNPPFDVRGTFRDILKAFDKVWHDGLILKLQTYGIDAKVAQKLLQR